MSKGQLSTMELFVMACVMLISILILVVVLPKTMRVFLSYFIYSSAEIVARDLSSLSSLSFASEETIIDYKVPTETATYFLEVDDRYLKILRQDKSYCKEEKYKEDEFCQSFYPVIYTKEFNLIEGGNEFVVENKQGNFQIKVLTHAK